MAGRYADQRVKTARAFRAYLDLMDTADWLRDRMSRQLENFDLTMMEFRVLETLHREGPLYQQALSRKFKCSKQNVGFVLKQLIEEGWIRRVPGTLARVDGGDGRTTVVIPEDEETDGERGPVPSDWIEKMKSHWKKFRPRMHMQLEDSGKLHKAALTAVVAMRADLLKAMREGQNVRTVMEKAEGKYFFLQGEKSKAKPSATDKENQQESGPRDIVPRDIVPRITEHWRRFNAEMFAQLERSGSLGRAAMKQALQARDACLKMTSVRHDNERAWAEVRKAYRFLPSEDESRDSQEQEGDSKNEDGNSEESSRGDGTAEDVLVDDDGRDELAKAGAASDSSARVAGRAAPRPAGRPAATGRAVVGVQLTPVGEALIADVVRKHAKAVKAQMRVLEGREQQTLSKLCRRIREGDVMKFVRELMMEDAEEEEISG